MSDSNQNAMDPNGLYKEENYTDQRTGAIRKLIPVKADGTEDPDRAVEYYGSAQVMTPMGAMPLNFALEGTTLGEAAEDFAGKAELAVEEAGRELERMRREQASKIVVPGQGGNGNGPGGSGIIT